MNKFIAILLMALALQACSGVSGINEPSDSDEVTRAGSPLPVPAPKPVENFKSMEDYLRDNSVWEGNGVDPEFADEIYTAYFDVDEMKVTIGSTIDDEKTTADFTIENNTVVSKSDSYILEGVLDENSGKLKVTLKDNFHDWAKPAAADNVNSTHEFSATDGNARLPVMEWLLGK